MATTKKTTTAEDVVEDVKTKTTTTKKKQTASETVNSDMENIIKSLAKKIEDLESQLKDKESNSNTVVESNVVDYNRMIKVTSMLNNTYNLSTTKYGKGGRTYTFERYGHSIPIRMKDLIEIISVYGDQFEKCWAVLPNKQDYIDLGIEYIYDDIFNQEKMEEILSLRNQSCIDIILDLEDNMLSSVLSIIAERISQGVKYDYNMIQILKSETDIQDFINSNQEEVSE